MATANKHTSQRVATTASRVLRDDRYAAKSKTCAGSALSQKIGKKSK